jgi:excisionase family DNA binding protein
MQQQQAAAAEQAKQQITDAELPDRPTVAEVARWLRKSISTIYLWCREGLIPCVRVGRSYIFDKVALIEWAKPKQEEAA